MSEQTIRLYCKELRLPTVGEQIASALASAERENWSLTDFLAHLLE